MIFNLYLSVCLELNHIMRKRVAVSMYPDVMISLITSANSDLNTELHDWPPVDSWWNSFLWTDQDDAKLPSKDSLNMGASSTDLILMDLIFIC